jgi:hypothetical protein
MNNTPIRNTNNNMINTTNVNKMTNTNMISTSMLSTNKPSLSPLRSRKSALCTTPTHMSPFQQASSSRSSSRIIPNQSQYKIKNLTIQVDNNKYT